MRLLLSILFAAPAVISLHGQASQAALQKKLEDLNSRLSVMEKENARLNAEMRARDSITYCAVRLEIFEACLKAPELNFDFKSTAGKIAVTGLFARLMQANNPSSDILGFRFTDIVFSACEEHFLKNIRKEKDRARLGQVISKIINNPVVSSLANTNPVTSVIAGIISALAGFTTTEAQVEGGKPREIEITSEDAIDERSIAAFRADLQVYIDFYEALLLASERYLDGLSGLEARYSTLSATVADYQARLLLITNDHADNMIASLSSLLPDPSSGHLEFNRYLSDNGIRGILEVIEDYPSVRKAVNQLRSDYQRLLCRFLSDYVSALESAGKFPAGTVDPASVDRLIAEIGAFMEEEGLAESTASTLLRP